MTRVKVIQVLAVVLMWAANAAAQQQSAARVADAAKARNASAVRALIAQGAGVNVPQRDGATALHWAAHWNDVPLAKQLIAAGARVNAANDYGVSPVFLAATNGSAAMLDVLLAAGGNANATLPFGQTVLMEAVRTGSTDAVRRLLAKGADVNAAQISRGQTALMWAAADGNLDLTRVLLEAGADLHARSKAGYTALMSAVREGHIDTVRFLLAAGSDVNASAKDGSTPLFIATVRAHVDLAMFLLEQGAAPDGNVDAAGHTPLMWAVGTFEQTQITYNGIEAPGEWGTYTGIPDRAAKLRLIKALLAKGANVSRQSTKMLPQLIPLNGGGSRPPHVGAAPFVIAAHSADAEVMRLLLAAGADPKITAKDGQTSIMAASEGIIENSVLLTEDKRIEAIKVALEAGVDIEAQDVRGYRAMHVAARYGYHDILAFLVSRGAELNPLSKPQKGDPRALTRYLLQAQSPLGLAEGTLDGIFRERTDTAEFLRKLGAKSIGRFDPNDYETNAPDATDEAFKALDEAAKKK